MRKTTPAILVSTITALVCLLMLSCVAYAAPPAATQKAAPQVQAAPSAASRMLDRNAPPSGTITITSPASGETWYPGDRKQIQWNCTGSCSLVDVTLWLGGVKTFVVGTAIGSGRTSYTVPTGAAAGSYELRVTSEYDTGVEAKQTVSVSPGSITVTAPKDNEVLYPGSQYTITWTYLGDLGQFSIEIGKDPKFQHSISPITASMGKGSAVWTVPVFPATGLRIGVTSKSYPSVWAQSGSFTIACSTSICGEKCVDLQTDYYNCGSCGHWCADAYGCDKGKCVCPSEFPTACPSKYDNQPKGTNVDGPVRQSGKKGDKQVYSGLGNDYDYCVNLQTDINNCGSCGKRCWNEACVNGSCVCQSPRVMCGSNGCTDLQSDRANCGSCGNVCPTNSWCGKGICY